MGEAAMQDAAGRASLCPDDLPPQLWTGGGREDRARDVPASGHDGRQRRHLSRHLQPPPIERLLCPRDSHGRPRSPGRHAGRSDLEDVGLSCDPVPHSRSRFRPRRDSPPIWCSSMRTRLPTAPPGNGRWRVRSESSWSWSVARPSCGRTYRLARCPARCCGDRTRCCRYEPTASHDRRRSRSLSRHRLGRNPRALSRADRGRRHATIPTRLEGSRTARLSPIPTCRQRFPAGSSDVPFSSDLESLVRETQARARDGDIAKPARARCHRAACPCGMSCHRGQTWGVDGGGRGAVGGGDPREWREDGGRVHPALRPALAERCFRDRARAAGSHSELGSVSS